MANRVIVRRLELLTELERADLYGFFTMPVDTGKLGIPHYTHVVPKPAHLGLVKDKVISYQTDDAFFADIYLVFENALRFNPRSTEIYRLASILLTWTKKEHKKFADFYAKEEERKAKEDEEHVQYVLKLTVQEDRKKLIDAVHKRIQAEDVKKQLDEMAKRLDSYESEETFFADLFEIVRKQHTMKLLSYITKVRIRFREIHTIEHVKREIEQAEMEEEA